MKRSVLSLALAATCCLFAAAFDAAPARAAAVDPNLPFHTLETPHFMINYPDGADAIAQKAAQYAEEAHAKVSAFMHTEPMQRTNITLMDHEDTINGLALPYVNNEIFVYMTTPDEDILWGRYDDFLKTVITHEYTHILHFETVDGLPGVVNKIFGRLLFPNLFMPTFMIEGLAVTNESELIPGGSRGYEAQYDMYLRADVLAHRQLTVDQGTGYYLTNFPGGDTPYFYGTWFYKYMRHRYGEDKPVKIAHKFSEAPWLGVDYACSQVIPGRTVQQIWDEMLHWETRRAEAEIAKIKEHPVTQTSAITTTGMYHRHPVYLPDGHLCYVEGLRHSPTYLVELMDMKDGKPQTRRLFTKSYYGSYDVTRDGKYLYYSNSNSKSNYYNYDDVFRYDMETGERAPITDSARAIGEGVSPDGQKLITVINGKGQTNLVLMQATGNDQGKILKQLTDLHDNTQFSSPRWSPDGKHVVCSCWHNGSRDLFLIDTDTWRVYPLWKDDFVDVDATWSPDGKYLVFASDRVRNVFNLYAFDWQTHELYQMTNVLTGAIEPAISPDMKTVAMSVPTGYGFDIQTMKWDPASWQKVTTPIFDPNSVIPKPFVQQQVFPTHPYNPIPSGWPKFWSPLYQSGNNTLGLFTLGYDVLLTNTIFLYGGYCLDPQVNLPPGTSLSPLDMATYTLLYSNTQLPTSFTVTVSGAPFKFAVPLANGSTLNLYQNIKNFTFGLGWNNLPSPLTNASWQTGDQTMLNYNVMMVNDMTPSAYNQQAEQANLMPLPARSNFISYEYQYNTDGKFGYSPSPEFGEMATYGLEFAHPWIGSETEFYRVFGDWRHFYGLPWTHHTIAVRLMGGLNLGKPQGNFYLGGTRSTSTNGVPDIRVAATPDDILEPLRGYPLASTGGNTIALLSTEYRFPIYEIQHGPGTLPLFAERIYGSLFWDNGTAYSNNWLSDLGHTLINTEPDQNAKMWPALSDFRSGLGFELRLNFKIANNPLNTSPLSTMTRSVMPALAYFNDSAGSIRLGVAQPLLPTPGANGQSQFSGPSVYTELGTFF